MHEISRRAFAGAGLFALLASHSESAAPTGAGRFGQINKLKAKTGAVAALHAELTAVAGPLVAALPGKLTYEILSSEADPGTLWTVEIWASADLHAKSVATQSVQASIARCRLLTQHFENLATFTLSA